MKSAPKSSARRQLRTGVILGIAMAACQGPEGDTPLKAPVNPEQVGEVRSSLESMLTRTPEGMTLTWGENGAQTVHVQGGFQHVFIVEKNPDGSFSTTCTDSLEIATRALDGTSSRSVEER